MKRVCLSRPRGNLAMVLVISALAFMVVSLTSASYLHQLRFASGESTKQRVSKMAESVTNLAVVDFQDDPTFGTPGHADYSKVYSYSRDGCEALLTFDPVKANDLGIKVSTNNFQGTTAVPGGAGQDVAAGQVELLGHATYHNTTTEVRHLIGVPDFSFVVATNGTFESNGTLLVGELPEGADPATVNLDDLLPGHLGADGDVKLSGTVDVLGNVQSGNHVETSGAINIRGEVYRNRPMPDLPVVDIDRYRTETPFTGNLPSGFTTSQTLSQHTLVDGNLTVSGTLELSDAILFVDGNLNVTGGASGVGAIFATGSVTFGGAANFQAGDGIALLAKGDVRLQGGGPSSLFRGLVYTEGSFEASNVTIIGNFVSNRPAGPLDDQFVLNNVRLFQADTTVEIAGLGPQLELTTAFPPYTPNAPWETGEPFIYEMTVVKDGDFYDVTLSIKNLLGDTRFSTNIDDYDPDDPFIHPVSGQVSYPRLRNAENLVHSFLAPEYPDYAFENSGFFEPGGVRDVCDQLDAAAAAAPGGPTSPGTAAGPSINFNQFINVRDRVRSTYIGQL